MPTLSPCPGQGSRTGGSELLGIGFMSSHASLSPPNLPENQFAKLPLMLSGNLQAVSSQGTTVTAGITATCRPHPEVRREVREPLPDHAGESPLLSRSGGATLMAETEEELKSEMCLRKLKKPKNLSK